VAARFFHNTADCVFHVQSTVEFYSFDNFKIEKRFKGLCFVSNPVSLQLQIANVYFFLIMQFASSIGYIFIGTSTDVSRYNGEYEHVFETAIGGVTLQAPQVGNIFGKLNVLSEDCL